MIRRVEGFRRLAHLSSLGRTALAAAIICGTLVSAAGAEETVAIRGGRILTVTRGVVDDGLVLIKGGQIVAVGKNITLPQDARLIDAAGGVVCPGLIDAFTNLGTSEPGSIGADSDEATSPLTPQLRIIDSLDPENRFIPLARRSGVTAALVAPGEGNLLSGQSALLRLAGDRLEDMVVRFPVGVHGSLGELPKLRYGPKNQMPSTRMGEAALLRQTWVEAQSYKDKLDRYEQKLADYRAKEKEGKAAAADRPEPPAKDFKLLALIPLLDGKQPWIVRANRMDDILTALRLAEEFQLTLILNHGAAAWRVADRLAVRNIPVLVGPAGADFQMDETQGARPDLAARLRQAGVKIAFQTGSTQNVSDLLSQAQAAVAAGLPKEEALKALTLYPAQIFGVADRLGSLEAGKLADLVIFDGDPLARTVRVKMVLIGGKTVFP